MKIYQKLAVGAVALAGATTMAVGVYAAQKPNGLQNRWSGLVSAIAQKFNLNPTDVQKVIDDEQKQERTQMDAQRVAQEKSRLDQAVKDGKLTQAQEDLIVAKQAEVKTFMDSLNGKSQTDRAAAMKTESEAIAQWVKDNNIPEGYMMGGPGMMGGRGMKGPGQNPKVMLDQAVKDGKLTQAQEDLIVAKQTEVKTFMDSLKDKSQTDRAAAMKTESEAIAQWVKDNNIPTQYFHFGFGQGGMRGEGFGGRMGGPGGPTPEQVTK